jgi:EryCIII-like glycosyltransferase
MSVARKHFLRTQPNWRDVAPQDQIRFIVPGLFAGSRVEPMLEGLGRIVPDWRPDLLVHDSAEMAGAIAAEVAGIAHAEHSFGVLRPLDLRQLAVDALQPVANRLGVPNPGIGGLGGEPSLDICPAAIQRPEIADLPQVQPLRQSASTTRPTRSARPGWLTSPLGRSST